MSNYHFFKTCIAVNISFIEQLPTISVVLSVHFLQYDLKKKNYS